MAAAPLAGAITLLFQLRGSGTFSRPSDGQHTHMQVSSELLQSCCTMAIVKKIALALWVHLP